MYQSRLFSTKQPLAKPTTSLWAGEREQSLHADVFGLGTQLVDSLVDSDEDKVNVLKQEVSDFEKSILGATNDQAVERILRTHDIYELAQRMTTRLRVLISSNHQLSHELNDKQREVDEKVRQLERDIVEW